MKHHLHSQLHPGTPETNNNSLSAGDLQGSLSHNVVDTKGQDDSEDQGKPYLVTFDYYSKCAAEISLRFQGNVQLSPTVVRICNPPINFQVCCAYLTPQASTQLVILSESLKTA